MISSALEFVHARKWLIELILLVVIVGAGYWFCHHLIEVGVQRQKDADTKALVELQRHTDIETGRLQGIADTAEQARAKEHTDLVDYQRTHPLHGGLCDAHGRQGGMPSTGTANGGDAHAGPKAADLQPLPSGDSPSRHRTDQLGLLDLLAGRCDAVSATLREYQARQ